MTPSSEILTGPRGRRLCLELAAHLDVDVRALIIDLAYEMDAGKGRSRMRMLFGDVGEERQPVPASPEALAQRIDELDAATLTSSDIDDALARSVDSAMYWQPPSGEDVVAAVPVVTSALAPIADEVVRRAPDWWSGSRRREQWAVEWREPGDPVPLTADPVSALRHWHAETVRDEERSRRERPGDPTANWSGTWWSTPGGVLKTTGVLDDGAPAGLRLVEDSLGWEIATAIPVRGAGRTYEIRSATDWAELCRRFPLEVTASRRHDWYRVTGRDGRWLIPDWHRVAADWDAVHLTVTGYLQAATRSIEIDDEYASVLAGWGPDTTAWLTDVAREWEGERVEWRFDRTDDAWLRHHESDQEPS